MSKLVADSEPLNKVLEGRVIPTEAIHEILVESQQDPTELFEAARMLRAKNKANFVTYSKKAFLNLVNLCRDTCSYCTYKAEPGESKLSLMSKQNVSDVLDMAKKYHCVEALFVTGESPEQRYPEAQEWLRENGFSSTIQYITYCSEIALEKGLFPHTNAGNLSKDEMRELQNTNVSLGLMLESSSERLTQRGGPHFFAPSKNPKDRLEVLKNAGELGIPMTTGILLGIGETTREIIDSIMAIKKIHDRYGNIQEIILQNFQPKPDTLMNEHPAADQSYFKTIVAITRIIIPDMNIQIPPNLSPQSYQSFIQTGINDWGGISPLTPDFVNPEFAWPKIQDVEKNCNDSGYELKCRFPVYPEFADHLNNDLKERMAEISDEKGYVREDYWR